MRESQIDRVLDRLDKDREQAQEDTYRRHLKRDRFRRWRNWATRIADDDE